MRHRCLEESSQASRFWEEEACDTSPREFGIRWLVCEEDWEDVRLLDETAEADAEVTCFF